LYCLKTDLDVKVALQAPPSKLLPLKGDTLEVKHTVEESEN